MDTRETSARFPIALDETGGHRIGPGIEHDRDALRGPLGREGHRARDRVDYVDLLAFETAGRRPHRLHIAFAIVHQENELLALLESQLPETVSQAIDGLEVHAPVEEDSHAIDTSLLCIGGERQRQESEHQDARENEP